MSSFAFAAPPALPLDDRQALIETLLERMTLAEKIGQLRLISIGGDMLWDFTTFPSTKRIAGGGVSYVAGEMVPLRFGYRRDQGRNLNQITAGAGFSKDKVGVEVALRQDIGGRKESYLIVMFRYVVQ